MVMSIGSAYGAITISMNNASNMQNSMNGNQSEPLPEQLTSIYENIANEDALQINLSAGINAGQENYIIDVEVEMDTSAGYENLALDGSIKIAQTGLAKSSTIYDIGFSYQNGMAFFDMFGGRIALETATIIQPVMSILKILNIQVPELGSLDLNSLTPEVILGMLTNFTEEKGDGQITLVIDVPVIGKINLVCDLDYCVQELALPEFAFNQSSSMTISSKITYPDFVEIEKKVESDYVKVGGLLSSAESILEYMSSSGIAFDFDFNFMGNKFAGSLQADLTTLSSMATLDLYGTELRLLAVDNIIYIEYGNILASFALSDFDKINNILETYFNIDVPLETITDILQALKNGDWANVIDKLDIDFSPSNIDLSILENVIVKGNLTALSLREIGDFGITTDDNGDLAKLAFSGHGVDAVLKTKEFKEFSLAYDTENYIDLALMIPTAENAISILQSPTVSGEIVLSLGNLQFPLQYAFNTSQKYGKVYGEILGGAIEISLVDGIVYVSFAEQPLVAVDMATIQTDINTFLAQLELDVEFDYLAQIFGGLGLIFNQNGLLFTSLEATDDGFILSTESMDIVLSNSLKEIYISTGFAGFGIEVSILGSALVVEKPIIENQSNFAQFKDILYLAQAYVKSGLLKATEGAVNYFLQGNMAFDFEVESKGETLCGKVDIDLARKALKLCIKLGDEQIELFAQNKALYVEFANIYAKFNINDLTQVERILNERFGIDLPLSTIIDIIDSINSNTPFAMLAGLGIVFDLSKIDLSFFDSIVVDGNKTTIPVEGIGEISLEVVNKMLSNIGFVANGVTARVDLVEFTAFDLSVEEEKYVDIAKFFPTLENAIDIVNCNTISGQIEANINGIELVLDYVVDKKNTTDIYAEFTTNLYGADLSIVYVNGKVYVNFADTFKLVSEIGNLPNAISEFLTEIGYELPESGTAVESAVGAMLSILFDKNKPFLVTGFVEKENGIEIEILNEINLSIVNGDTTLSLTAGYDKYSAKISLIGSDIEIVRADVVESEYNTIENLLAIAGKAINKGFINLAEGAFNYFKSGLVGIDFNATYNGTSLSGNIFFHLANKEILVSVLANEVEFNVIVKNEVAYLELGNIFAKFAVSDIDKIENLLKDKFGIEIPLTEIVDKLTNTEIGDKPLEKLKDLGLVINLNGFNLSFFDGVEVDGNVTTISVDGVGEFALTLTDKVLSSIGFVGNGFDISANLVEFEEITLSVSEDTYLELVSLLPTIENAIDIVNCNAISGSMTLNVGLSEPIVVDYYVDKSDINDIYAEFTTVIQGANAKIVYYAGKVYIEFASSIKLVADFETLPATIENLLAKADIAFDIKDDIDTSNIINTIFDIINPSKNAQLISSLTQIENGLEIGVGGIVITLTNGSTQIEFATSDVSGVIIGGDVRGAIPVMDDSAYTPLEDMLDLVEAFLNMAKKKDFHITGSFDVIGTLVGINIKWNIPFDIRIKDNNGDIEMLMTMGEIPVVVGLNNDVPYKTGDTNGGKGRYVSIYMKDGAVYIYRTEYVNQLFGWDARKYEKCTKITAGSFLADPMYYFQYALGFSDAVMDAMADSFSKAFNRDNPLNLNNIVNSLTVVDGENFELILNLAELANNNLLDTLTLDLGLGIDDDGESILQRLGLEMFMPLASVFEMTLSTDDTMIVDWGKEVDMSALYNYVNNYQYAFDAEWEASNGSWSKASEITYTISFEENGGEIVDDITGAYGTEFNLPTLSPSQTDDGEKQISRIFMGWYTTSTFDEGTEFTGNTIPKGDKTLYAKWYEYVRYYRTISFVTNSNEIISPIKALEGDNITLPSLSIKEEANETSVTIYTFVGWYTDEALTNEFTTYQMPSANTTLYAKWEVADVEEAYLLQVFDGGNAIYTRYILAGNAIDLSGVAKVNDTTKFYLQSNYTTQYEGDFIMPEENLTLYIRNQYTLTYTSSYGTVQNRNEKVWQGETLSLPAQSTYYDDDGTTRKITYSFSGYLVNGSVGELPTIMPNSDVSIVAVWSVETKKYYTITFNTGWVKCDEWMDNNSNVSGKITQKSAPTPVAPLTLLEGTTFDPSVYTSTCKYEYKAVWIGANYNFKVLTWNTEGVKNISNGASNDKYTKLTSYTVTGNATLYPTWGTY